MIECAHVYKRYKTGTNALYDINLKVDQGEFIYIIGPTGSGKSTLIKLLDGEIAPTKGIVKVVGIDVGSLKNKQVPIYRRNIGVVFQDYKLLPQKTVAENVAYALEVINVKKKVSFLVVSSSVWRLPVQLPTVQRFLLRMNLLVTLTLPRVQKLWSCWKRFIVITIQRLSWSPMI